MSGATSGFEVDDKACCLIVVHNIKPYAWLRERVIANALAGLIPATLLDDLNAAIEPPKVSTISIAIVAPFNSGKSTLINRLIGRSLLPTRDFTETGTSVRLRNGDEWSAAAYDTDKRRPIEPTAAALMEVTSLLDIHGERRASEQIARDVLIEVPGARLPAAVTLIDTPGLNDGAAMNDRSVRIAAEADRVIYLLASRHFLAESDLNNLTLLLSSRDPSTIHLALNGFLDAPTQSRWGAFLSDRLPLYRDRLCQRLPDIGLSDGHIDEIAVVCAAEPADGSDLGLSNFRHTLELISAEARRDAIGTRKTSAALALQQSRALIQERIDAQRRELAGLAEQDRRHDEDCAANEALRSEISFQVIRRRDMFAQAVGSLGEKLKESIKTWDIARAGSILTKFQADLSRLARADAADTLRELGHGQSLNLQAVDSITSRFDIPPRQLENAAELSTINTLQTAARSLASVRIPQGMGNISSLRGIGALMGATFSGAAETTIAELQRAIDNFKNSISDVVAQAIGERNRRAPEIEILLYDLIQKKPQQKASPDDVKALEERLREREAICDEISLALDHLSGRLGPGSVT
jgi:hypothetical protein